MWWSKGGGSKYLGSSMTGKKSMKEHMMSVMNKIRDGISDSEIQKKGYSKMISMFNPTTVKETFGPLGTD